MLLVWIPIVNIVAGAVRVATAVTVAATLAVATAMADATARSPGGYYVIYTEAPLGHGAVSIQGQVDTPAHYRPGP